jgi:hypothetical protein
MAETFKSESAARAITHALLVTIAVGALPASTVTASTNATPSPISENLRTSVHPDVQYQRKNLLDDENAWTSWEKGVEAFKRIERSKARKYIEPGEMGFPLNDAEPWLRENTNTLALLDDGIGRGKCQFPYPDQGYHTILPYLGTLISLADAKLLRAKVRMREGQFEKAAQDLIGLLRLSELVANADGGFVNLRYGWTIDRRTTEGIVALLRYPQVRSQVLQQLLSATTFSRDPVESLRDALRIEMECFLMFASEWPDNLTNATETEIVMGSPPKGMKPPLVDEAAWTNRFDIHTGSGGVGYHKALLSGHPNALDIPATIRLFSACLDHLAQQANLPVLVQQTNEPCAEMIACQKLDQFWNAIPAIRSNRTYYVHLKGDDLIKVQRALAQMDNPVGKQIVLSRVRDSIEHPTQYPSLSPAEQIAVWQLQREAMKTCIALRLYWEQNGKLPLALAKLVESAILPSVPVDPFTGNALRYSETRKLVWSDALEKRGSDRPFGSRDIKFAWNVSLPADKGDR